MTQSNNHYLQANQLPYLPLATGFLLGLKPLLTPSLQANFLCFIYEFFKIFIQHVLLTLSFEAENAILLFLYFLFNLQSIKIYKWDCIRANIMEILIFYDVSEMKMWPSFRVLLLLLEMCQSINAMLSNIQVYGVTLGMSPGIIDKASVFTDPGSNCLCSVSSSSNEQLPV